MKKFVAIIASTMLAGAAFAAEFADLDIDGDGYLSVEETAAVENLDVMTADTDGDGVLSEEEYAAATAVPAEEDIPAVEEEVPAEEAAPEAPAAE